MAGVLIQRCQQCVFQLRISDEFLSFDKKLRVSASFLTSGKAQSSDRVDSMLFAFSFMSGMEKTVTKNV